MGPPSVLHSDHQSAAEEDAGDANSSAGRPLPQEEEEAAAAARLLPPSPPGQAASRRARLPPQTQPHPPLRHRRPLAGGEPWSNFLLFVFVFDVIYHLLLVVSELCSLLYGFFFFYFCQRFSFWCIFCQQISWVDLDDDHSWHLFFAVKSVNSKRKIINTNRLFHCVFDL